MQPQELNYIVWDRLNGSTSLFMLSLIRSALYLLVYIWNDVQTSIIAALFAVTKDWKSLRYSSGIKRNKVKKKTGGRKKKKLPVYK